MHLFLLKNDYWALLDELEAEGKELSRLTAADCGLRPKNESNHPSVAGNGSVTYWAELWVDHISLMNALQKSGLDTTIESDFATQTITVTLR